MGQYGREGLKAFERIKTHVRDAKLEICWVKMEAMLAELLKKSRHISSI
jgi:hypothetical protein